MSSKHKQQKKLYNILEEITTDSFKSDIELIQTLIKEVVDNQEFNIIGGRIWMLDPSSNSYKLNFQYGDAEEVPSDYKVSIKESSLSSHLKKISTQRTHFADESDELLIRSGIKHYSMTGSGDLIKIDGNKYYEYIFGFNVDEITDTFKESIHIIGSFSAMALKDFRNSSIQQKVEKDYQSAKEIQQSILPDHSANFLDYELYGVCIPDNEVGGDFFDFITNTDHIAEEERLSVIISDASSKGVPAAIQSLFVSGALRMGMAFSTRISHILSLLNSLIFKTFPYERFVTLFMCELSPTSNRLILYANAGHCSPIHFRKKKNDFKELKPTGGLLGIVENQKFGVDNTSMKPGDILVMFTDGINEAQNSKEELFGEEIIKEIISKNSHLSSRKIANLILDEVTIFSVNSNYTDDKTIVVIKRKETD